MEEGRELLASEFPLGEAKVEFEAEAEDEDDEEEGDSEDVVIDAKDQDATKSLNPELSMFLQIRYRGYETRKTSLTANKEEMQSVITP